VYYNIIKVNLHLTNLTNGQNTMSGLLYLHTIE